MLGGALSGIAAENLQRESRDREPDAGVVGEGLAGGPRAGFTSATYWSSTRPAWSAAASLSASSRRPPSAGAKVVLVGDAEQLQPIEAGAAFRAIAERVGYQELSGIRRQREAWQREASRISRVEQPGRALRPLPGAWRDPLRREPRARPRRI